MLCSDMQGELGQKLPGGKVCKEDLSAEAPGVFVI